MAVVHSSHIGIEGCIRRARDTLYWPRMATDLREYISKCDIRLSHHLEQSKEPLLQHEVIARPWANVAGDLCERDNCTLLVIVVTLLVITYYYGNFNEVARLNSVTSRSVIKEMKAVFARYLTYSSRTTALSLQLLNSQCLRNPGCFNTSRPPLTTHSTMRRQKTRIKTVKRLFTKCKNSGQSEFLALLDWRNTPTEGVGTMIMGRRCKTLLLIASTLLQPRYSTNEESRAFIGKKERQRFYYNKHTKPPQPILQGETVRMKLPGQKAWSAGTCLGPVGPSSYDIRINGSIYRRNRC